MHGYRRVFMITTLLVVAGSIAYATAANPFEVFLSQALLGETEMRACDRTFIVIS